jgi:hypothetical protein
MRAFEAGGVTKLVCAFSREPGKPKAYVQQAIAANGDTVWDLLQKEAPVFVCGETHAHGARNQAGVRRPFLPAHRRLPCRRQDVARRVGRKSPQSGGHLGVIGAGCRALLSAVSRRLPLTYSASSAARTNRPELAEVRFLPRTQASALIACHHS